MSATDQVIYRIPLELWSTILGRTTPRETILFGQACKSSQEAIKRIWEMNPDHWMFTVKMISDSLIRYPEVRASIRQIKDKYFRFLNLNSLRYMEEKKELKKYKNEKISKYGEICTHQMDLIQSKKQIADLDKKFAASISLFNEQIAGQLANLKLEDLTSLHREFLPIFNLVKLALKYKKRRMSRSRATI